MELKISLTGCQVPEFCGSLVETAVLEHLYELIFAFDEVIAMGYREKVNVMQVKTFIEMESHEEKVHEMLEKNRIREAKMEAKRRMKEIEQQKQDNLAGRIRGMGGGSMQGMGGGSGFGSGSFGAGHMGSVTGGFSSSLTTEPQASPPKTASTSKKGMVLKKAQKTDDYLRALEAEGEIDLSSTPLLASVDKAAAASGPDKKMEAVHVSIGEKITVVLNHEGGLENMDVRGNLEVVCNEADKSKINIKLSPLDNNFQTKLHPNIDKARFSKESVIALRGGRSYPLKAPQGVLIWRYVTKDESKVPLNGIVSHLYFESSV